MTSLKRCARLLGAAGLAAPLALGTACAADGRAGAPWSQGLQDPTRPPAAASAAPSASADAAAGPQLQSVQVGAGAGGLRIAVIDGESVRVGERFHGARVVRIADDHVELRRGGERQVLRLYAPMGTGGMTRVAPGGKRREKGEP